MAGVIPVPRDNAGEFAGDRGRIQPTTNGSVRKSSQPGFGVRGRLTFQVRFSKLPESFGAFAMRSPNEFWIALHDLTTATHAEGDSLDQRQRNIYYTLVQMPPIAQQEVLDELAEMAMLLPELRLYIRRMERSESGQPQISRVS